MKKLACFLGLILSIALIALGLYTMTNGLVGVEVDDNFDLIQPNFSGDTASSTSFGADFYTYSYRATRYAANNVDALGDYLEQVVNVGAGTALCVTGLFGLLLSLYGFGAASASKKQLKLLKQIANKQITVPAAPAQKAPAATTPVAKAAAPAPAAPARKPASSGETWACQICGHNNPGHLSSCDICGNPKGAAPKKAPARTETPAGGEAWMCPVCAMENPGSATECVCCNEPRPSGAAPVQRAAGTWTCQNCGMQNNANATECPVCGEHR